MAPQVTSQAEAVRILQDLLDRLSDAIVAQDVETVRDGIKLPLVRRTLTSQAIIETEDDLDLGTIGTSQALVARGVNQFIRLVSDAEFLSPGYIVGYYVTHLLRNGLRVAPSYPNRAILCNDGGRWKISEMHSGLEHTEWPLKKFEVPDTDHRVHHPPLAEQDMRRTLIEPLDIYQRFLNELSAANMAKDVDAFGALVGLPYTLHHQNNDLVINSLNDLKPAFDTVTALLEKTQADRFERIADRAEFISGTMICGYHVSHMYRDDEVVLGPIHSRMILKRVGPKWFLISATNAVTNETYPYSDPLTQQKLVTIREIQERQRQ